MWEVWRFGGVEVCVEVWSVEVWRCGCESLCRVVEVWSVGCGGVEVWRCGGV